jgi:hypothetical protein
MWADLDIAERGDIARADPQSGEFIAVRRGDMGVRQYFAPFESVLLVVGAKATRGAPPEYGDKLAIVGDWTVRRLSSYALGEDDFDIRSVEEKPVPTSPGDWTGFSSSISAARRSMPQGSSPTRPARRCST